MSKEDFARRLRVSGIVAIVAIAALVLAQAIVLVWRFQTSPVRTTLVDLSGFRRSLTMEILYFAARAEADPAASRDLDGAVDALAARQGALGDLDGADRALYDRFIASARGLTFAPRDRALSQSLRASGPALFGVYDRKTAQYAGTGSLQRRTFYWIVLVDGSATLIVLGLMYFLIMRRRDEVIVSALADSEARQQRFAAMFDNSFEMMAIYEVDGSIVRANRSALERLGFGAEVAGKPFEVHVAPESRKAVAKEFALAATGHAVQFEATFLDATGSEFPVAASLSPILVRKRVVGVVGAARDITEQRLHAQELLLSRERFRSLFAQNPNAVVAVDTEGIVTGANAEAERISGYSVEELVGRPFEMLVPLGGRASFRARVAELLTGQTRSYQATILRRDGSEILLSVDASPIRAGNKVEGVFFSGRDATTDAAIRRTLAEKDERINVLLNVAASAWSPGAQIDEALSLGSHTLGMQYGFVVRVEDGTLTVRHRWGPDDFLPIGYSMPVTASIGGRLISSPHAIAIDDLTLEPYATELRERNLPWKSYIGSRITVDREPYGSLVYLDRSVRRVPFNRADIDFIDVMSALISSAVAREVRGAELAEKATHDALTGLPNRTMLEEHFARMVARAQRTNGRVAVHYVDLDGFKPINDAYGHAAGDEVLCEVARRFRSAARTDEIVARIGGDEFVVLQADAGDASIAALSARLADRLEEDIALSTGAAVAVGASFGVGLYPDQGRDLQSLLQAADVEMYRSKRAKKNATV